MEELVSTYGYAAVFVGTFLEGETILVLGGFAAHRGYLELPFVIFSAFAGTLLGDQLYFYLGRVRGIAFLEKKPAWKIRTERVFALLNRRQYLLILGFRFIYGLRTITPFLLGASGVSRTRFLVLNLIGAAVWAIAVGILGYVFGQAFELLLGDLKRYEMWLFMGLAAIGSAVWCIHFIAKKNTP